MVDTVTFNRLKSRSSIDVASVLKEELVAGELTEDHLLICTNKIPIFSFQDKKFYIAVLDNITEIVFNEQLFGQLVLPESHKELVRFLVENHSTGVSFDDFVEGKGLGLVLLLHGPPGVGKTMTAEGMLIVIREKSYPGSLN